jgi:nucleoside-diphosphate-sugar epimerase
MKILVTGATGFIGKRLAERLVLEGHDVICTGRRLVALGKLLPDVKALYLDIENKESIKNIFRREKPDIVFHCAALVVSNSISRLMRANRDGTRNLFEACLSENIKKVVYLSSIAVISGNQQVPLTDDLPYAATNRYGQSKIEAEEIAISYRERGISVSVIRPVFVYGEDEPHLLGLMCRLARWRLLPIIGNGKARIHLIDIDNLVDIMMIALSNEKAYKGTYIAGDDDVLEIGEFFEYIAKCQSAKAPFRIPQAMISFFRTIPFIREKVSYFVKDRFYSIERLKQELGYTPRICVYDGLKKAIRNVSKKIQ